MRNLLFVPGLWILIFSSDVYCGGTIGGTGTIIMDQPDLGVERIIVSAADFRRARSRLSISDETSVIYQGTEMRVAKSSGGILDISGVRQLVPDPTQ